MAAGFKDIKFGGFEEFAIGILKEKILKVLRRFYWFYERLYPSRGPLPEPAGAARVVGRHRVGVRETEADESARGGTAPAVCVCRRSALCFYRLGFLAGPVLPLHD